MIFGLCCWQLCFRAAWPVCELHHVIMFFCGRRPGIASQAWSKSRRKKQELSKCWDNRRWRSKVANFVVNDNYRYAVRRNKPITPKYVNFAKPDINYGRRRQGHYILPLYAWMKDQPWDLNQTWPVDQEVVSIYNLPHRNWGALLQTSGRKKTSNFGPLFSWLPHSTPHISGTKGRMDKQNY